MTPVSGASPPRPPPKPYALFELPDAPRSGRAEPYRHHYLGEDADAQRLLALGVTYVTSGRRTRVRVVYRDWARGGLRLDLADVRATDEPRPRIIYHPAWGLVLALARATATCPAARAD